MHVPTKTVVKSLTASSFIQSVMWGDDWFYFWRRRHVVRSLVAWALRLGIILAVGMITMSSLLLVGKTRVEVAEGGEKELRAVILRTHPPPAELLTSPKTVSVARDSDEVVGMENNMIVPRSQVLPGCPSTPPHLLGQVEVAENVSLVEAEARLGPQVKRGGFSWPAKCEARFKVAIIVPYRDRQHQVGPFLNHMHTFLRRQQLNYSIYFVEQYGSDLFNRARLLNVGFLEARKEGPWDCYAFHDVDMLPENDFHLYHCSPQPRHLAVATSNNNYRSSHSLRYNTYFGGACLMTEAHIKRVNGWSNIYWGWGGEDDDMWRRIAFTDMAVWRYPARYARYKMIRHKPQVVNKHRYKVLARNTGKFPTDGLNSLTYTLKSVTRYPLYTHILADIGSSNENILTHKKTPIGDAQKS
ncbi:beta-1,4-galactosyltransferase 4-like [Panulirus ornatus]|uniref:beta-1,4-galactosyltransferase 4-like n=1 Tax=Panulirus ornatus TaxID=150431 RepID=UPI003A880E33